MSQNFPNWSHGVNMKKTAKKRQNSWKQPKIEKFGINPPKGAQLVQMSQRLRKRERLVITKLDKLGQES